MEDHELEALRPRDYEGGECGAKLNLDGVKEDGGPAPLMSPSIELALGGRPDSTDEKFNRSVKMDRRSDCWRTSVQSLELRLQTPVHPAIPLRRTVATFIGSTDSAIYRTDQSCMEFGSEESKHKSMADPELGRCRRTDGKKWRCRKKSILEQKYCERHIHRGRQCSRKPVEECEINSPAITPAPSRVSHNQSESKNSIVSAPVKLITTSIITKSTANSTRGNHTSYDKISAINDDEDCYNKSRTDFLHNKGSGPNSFEDGSLTLGLGFSPRSVLQVPGKNSARFDSQTGMIKPEPGRCRRTDGKKWRCSRDSIPNKKYCGIHMHRGSIKKFKSCNEEVSSIPNTNLSMSIRPNHRPKQIEGKTSSSSGSETTISETTIPC